MKQISSALSFMHESGFAHCNLNSSTIIVTRKTISEPSSIKLVDYTFAKNPRSYSSTVSGSSHTSSADTIISSLESLQLFAAYSDPQLLKQTHPPDFASDVFALGTLIWELAFCSLAFEGQSEAEIKSNIISGVKEQIPQDVLPQTLANIILQCWRRSRRDRISCSDANYLLSSVFCINGGIHCPFNSFVATKPHHKQSRATYLRFRACVTASNTDSIRAMGEIIEIMHGKGFDSALEWYALGAELGNSSCAYNAAMIYRERGSTELYTRFLKLGANLGHVKSIVKYREVSGMEQEDSNHANLNSDAKSLRKRSMDALRKNWRSLDMRRNGSIKELESIAEEQKAYKVPVPAEERFYEQTEETSGVWRRGWKSLDLRRKSLNKSRTVDLI